MRGRGQSMGELQGITLHPELRVIDAGFLHLDLKGEKREKLLI